MYRHRSALLRDGLATSLRLRQPVPTRLQVVVRRLCSAHLDVPGCRARGTEERPLCRETADLFSKNKYRLGLKQTSATTWHAAESRGTLSLPQTP